jgi:LysM repeat protein
MQLRFSGDDASSQRSRQALEQQRLAALRNALGPERFAAYQTTQDPAYRDAMAAAQQAGGNDDTALALYDIQRATADELNRIRSDPRLSEAQKQLLLRQTELEQQKARSLVLGEQLPDEAATAAAVPSQPQVYTHALEPFETLGRLSQRYGVRLSALRDANPGVDINRAPPGTVIVIPPPDSAPLPLPPLPPGLPARR